MILNPLNIYICYGYKKFRTTTAICREIAAKPDVIIGYCDLTRDWIYATNGHFCLHSGQFDYHITGIVWKNFNPVLSDGAIFNSGSGRYLFVPCTDNEGIRIYYSTEGDRSKPALVLMHWFMGSHRTWFDIGWVRDLSPHFFLILPDHRGYGKSDKPHEPQAYQPRFHVDDILKILDELDIQQAHFMGYSMGGRIGYALLSYAPDHVMSMVIGGMHPFSSETIPTDLDKRIELLQQGMEKTLTTYGIGPKPVFERMLENDADALIADTRQTREWEGLEDDVILFTDPVLLFVGKKDGFYQGMKLISKRMKNARFVAFPKENHRTAFLKRTLLSAHLSRFWGVSL